MWRFICAGVIGVTLFTGRPLFAQGPPGPPSKDTVRKLERELEVLRQLTQDVEERLQKAKSAAKKSGPGFGWGPGSFGKGPWAGPGGFGKGPWAGPGGRGFGKGPKPGMGGGFGPKPGPGGPKGESKGGPSPRGDLRTPDSRTADIERRLDQILREVEDLRRQIKKR